MLKLQMCTTLFRSVRPGAKGFSAYTGKWHRPAEILTSRAAHGEDVVVYPSAVYAACGKWLREETPEGSANPSTLEQIALDDTTLEAKDVCEWCFTGLLGVVTRERPEY